MKPQHGECFARIYVQDSYITGITAINHSTEQDTANIKEGNVFGALTEELLKRFACEYRAFRKKVFKRIQKYTPEGLPRKIDVELTRQQIEDLLSAISHAQRSYQFAGAANFHKALAVLRTKLHCCANKVSH